MIHAIMYKRRPIVTYNGTNSDNNGEDQPLLESTCAETYAIGFIR